MQYRFEVDDFDRSDLSSGHVLRSRPGFPAFPVRLGSEVFQQLIELGGWSRPVQVWDPLCGSGYLITTIALLHRHRIAGVVASDIDPEAVELARRNLSLLTRDGLDRRAVEVGPEATAAAERLASQLAADGGDLSARVAVADALDPSAVRSIAADPPVDVVLTDVPYGTQTQWSGQIGHEVPLVRLVETISSVVPNGAVLGVAGPRLRRLGGLPRPRRHLRVGHRSILLWSLPLDAP